MIMPPRIGPIVQVLVKKSSFIWFFIFIFYSITDDESDSIRTSNSSISAETKRQATLIEAITAVACLKLKLKAKPGLFM